MQKEFHRSTLVSLLVIILSFLVFGIVLVELEGYVWRTTGEVAEARHALREYSKTLELLADLKHVAPFVTRYHEGMKLLLPQKDELIDFPRWLDGISRVNQVSSEFAFQGQTVSPGTTEPGYIAFTLTVSGGAEQLLRFFEEVEIKSNRFLTSFDSFDMTQGEGSARASSRGKVFFR